MRTTATVRPLHFPRRGRRTPDRVEMVLRKAGFVKNQHLRCACYSPARRKPAAAGYRGSARPGLASEPVPHWIMPRRGATPTVKAARASMTAGRQLDAYLEEPRPARSQMDPELSREPPGQKSPDGWLKGFLPGEEIMFPCRRRFPPGSETRRDRTDLAPSLRRLTAVPASGRVRGNASPYLEPGLPAA